MYLILKDTENQENTRTCFKNNGQKYKQIPKMGAIEKYIYIYNLPLYLAVELNTVLLIFRVLKEYLQIPARFV